MRRLLCATILGAALISPAYAADADDAKAPALSVTPAMLAAAVTPAPAPAANADLGTRSTFKYGRPSMLPALYATSAALQGYDAYSTLTALKSGGVEAKAVLKERLETGDPPDAFQTNAFELKQGFIAASPGLLKPLDDVFEAQGLIDDLAPEALSDVTVDGHYMAVPVNIHRTNSLFYNERVFAELNLAPPTSLDELYAVSEELQTQGVVPLAVGAKGSWTLALLFFENLLIAKQGADFYRQYFSGKVDNAADPRVLEVLDESLRLWRYTNADARQIEWDAAVAMVHDGRAAMTVMGDWAKGALEQLGGVPGKTFGQIPFPGTAGVFVFTADTFPLPRGAPRRKDALDFLGTLASLKGKMPSTRSRARSPLAPISTPARTMRSLER